MTDLWQLAVSIRCTGIFPNLDNALRGHLHSESIKECNSTNQKENELNDYFVLGIYYTVVLHENKSY